MKPGDLFKFCFINKNTWDINDKSASSWESDP